MPAKKSQVSPIGRVSFPSVFQPHAFEEGEPKYEVVMLFDPEELAPLKAAAAAAVKEKFGDSAEKVSKAEGFKSPFHCGDDKDYDGYAGKTWVRFTSKQPPAVVNESVQPISEASGDFYAGCHARVSYTVYAYDFRSKGVAFGLVNIQKVGNGEPFAGRTSPEDDFGAVAAVSGGGGEDIF
jgi:hypothetical protein